MKDAEKEILGTPELPPPYIFWGTFIRQTFRVLLGPLLIFLLNISFGFEIISGDLICFIKIVRPLLAWSNEINCAKVIKFPNKLVGCISTSNL